MAPTLVDWDARPRAWLMYLKHLKDTDETAHQDLIANKLDAGDLADVKWAASAQRTGDHQQQHPADDDDTDSVVFSDAGEEELQWKDPKEFLRSWTHAKAKQHRAKIRVQRQQIQEARKKGCVPEPKSGLADITTTVHELPADDGVVPGQTTTTNTHSQTNTNVLESPPSPSPPTAQSGPRQSTFSSALADTTTAAPGLSTAPPSTHTGTVPEDYGRARHHDQGGRKQTGLGDQYGGRRQTGLDGGRRASPAATWSSSAPAVGPAAADVQAIKDIGRRRYAEQLEREEEEMMDGLGRLRTG